MSSKSLSPYCLVAFECRSAEHVEFHIVTSFDRHEAHSCINMHDIRDDIVGIVLLLVTMCPVTQALLEQRITRSFIWERERQYWMLTGMPNCIPCSHPIDLPFLTQWHSHTSTPDDSSTC